MVHMPHVDTGRLAGAPLVGLYTFTNIVLHLGLDCVTSLAVDTRKLIIVNLSTFSTSLGSQLIPGSVRAAESATLHHLLAKLAGNSRFHYEQ
jgi:hypothetical protein